MKRFDLILEALENMDENELVSVHNEYCDAVNYYDDRYYFMDEFDELFYGKSPLEILDAVENDFSTNDEYFTFNGYGYATSTSYPDIDIETIAEYIDDNDNALYNDEIQEILNDNDDDNDDDDETM